MLKRYLVDLTRRERTDLLGLLNADSDEVGQLFRRDVGHAFRFQAGPDSDLKSATWG